jgi:hypothetical protein
MQGVMCEVQTYVRWAFEVNGRGTEQWSERPQLT